MIYVTLPRQCEEGVFYIIYLVQKLESSSTHGLFVHERVKVIHRQSAFTNTGLVLRQPNSHNKTPGRLPVTRMTLTALYSYCLSF
jgi:hypothetical protein